MPNEAPEAQVPQSNEPQTEEGSHMGPVIGTVIIIAILIFGGLYFWGAQINEQNLEDITEEDVLPAGGGDVQTNDDLSNSDEPAAIEEDFNDTDLQQLEADFEADLEAMEQSL